MIWVKIDESQIGFYLKDQIEQLVRKDCSSFMNLFYLNFHSQSFGLVYLFTFLLQRKERNQI